MALIRFRGILESGSCFGANPRVSKSTNGPGIKAPLTVTNRPYAFKPMIMNQTLKARAAAWTIAAVGLITATTLPAGAKTIASFRAEDSMQSWTSVNDDVMGGVSKGGIKRSKEGTMVFSGSLSLENNGGFASVRMKPAELGLSGMSALVVKARGDGRTYWVDLRLKDQMSASSYRAYLPTAAGKWTETTLSFADFKLQTFGIELPGKTVDPTQVASVGFTIADKKQGPFELEVEAVKATGVEGAAKPAKGNGTLVDVAKSAGGFKTLLAAAEAADLVGVLSGEGPLTVLAPTDDAFAKLPAGTVEALLKPENREQLVAILKNHVIPGRVSLAKALEAGEGISLQGSKIPFIFDDGRVRVGVALLAKADIEASNGVIHVIDQVLVPAMKSGAPLKASGLVELAIERGVPVFNEGNAAGCAAIYEVTLESLRGMAGVSEAAKKVMAKALQEARSEKSPTQQAWILRGALDYVYPSLD
ncbi:MAG: hypothetical protein B9S38_13570 [Verrucomicrobiia bacterium Tous-C4TDCM]|nr:MAG: hypothetical protein B9S38_13570 [Verrucomicrobiae bacterium Tous-C4TDCM]